MFPALSITTDPCVGPIADLPSGRNPHPGTVSNVIAPAPIRTGLTATCCVPASCALAREKNTALSVQPGTNAPVDTKHNKNAKRKKLDFMTNNFHS
jgi:hypothetical protein